MTNRAKQAIETKKRIYIAGTKLTADRPIDKIAVADICNAAGVSIGSFYHYFHSKEDMLMGGYILFDNYVESVFKNYTFENNLAAIRALVCKQLGTLKNMRYGQMSEILRIQLKIDNNYVVSRGRSFFSYVYGCVEKAIEAGEISKDFSIDDATDTIFRTVRGILFDWCARRGEYDLIPKAMHDLDLLFQSLKNGIVFSNYVFDDGVKILEVGFDTVSEP